jgi:hypothetical protein
VKRQLPLEIGREKTEKRVRSKGRKGAIVGKNSHAKHGTTTKHMIKILLR